MWRRQRHPTPVLLPGKSHGRRSLVGCSPWGREESDTTEWLHFHFSLSCIGEGNSNPPQCSCLENSRDGGAWWAAVYGVTQSWTRLKRFSSSSSSSSSSSREWVVVYKGISVLCFLFVCFDENLTKATHASSGSSVSPYNQVLPLNTKAYICIGVYDSFGAKKNYFISG